MTVNSAKFLVNEYEVTGFKHIMFLENLIPYKTKNSLPLFF